MRIAGLTPDMMVDEHRNCPKDYYETIILDLDYCAVDDSICVGRPTKSGTVR